MGYDVDIKRIGAMTLFDLKGTQKAILNWCGPHLPGFPDTPNSAATRDEAMFLHIGKDHWLLLADLSQEGALYAHLKPTEAPPDISVVCVSDTQCFFAITGADVDQILSIASPLDIHATIFPENGATYSEAFGLKALILRKPEGYWLAVEQSFGDMLEDYLSRATA
ncbi:MAG: sarcosine oxidase subunit gamma [Silicimonas sp.]|nr:sarcosine oxidase subunit gamma [Silicimonas sp.]